MSSIKEGLYKPSLLHTGSIWEINWMLSLGGWAGNDGKGWERLSSLFPLHIIPCMLQLFSLPRRRANNPLQPKQHKTGFCRREIESYEPGLYVSVNVLPGVSPPSYNSITIAIFIVHTCPWAMLTRRKSIMGFLCFPVWVWDPSSCWSSANPGEPHMYRCNSSILDSSSSIFKNWVQLHK